MCFVSSAGSTPTEVLAELFLSEDTLKGHMDCLISAQAVQFLLLAHKIGLAHIDSAYDWVSANISAGAGKDKKTVSKNIRFGNARGPFKDIPLVQEIFFNVFLNFPLPEPL